MEDLTDLKNYINECSKNKGMHNRIYGLRWNDGILEGKICDEEREIFWLPKHQLCSYHEKLINTWLKL